MKQYLLSVYHPEGDIPEPEVMEKINADVLALNAEISKRGVAFRMVEARSSVRDMLRIEGVEEKVSRIDRFTMLADAIEDFQSGAAPKS